MAKPLSPLPLTFISSALILSSPLSVLAQSSAASSENYELKYKIQQSLGRASPMTLFGPVVSQDIKLTDTAAGYHVDVIKPQLFGVLPLDQLSFDLTPTHDDLYRINNMTLPSSIELDPSTALNIGAVALEGDWSFTDFSYKTLDATLQDLSVQPSSGEPLMTLEALDIDVKSSDSAEIHLQLTELSEQLVGGNQIGSASIRLFADGDQQLDIHQIFSEVLTQGVLNDNFPAAYQLLLSLKDNNYDQVTLEVAATDLALNDGYSDMGLADGLQLSIDLSDVTPERWGEALAVLSIDQFRSDSIFDDYTWQAITGSDYDYDADDGPESLRDGAKLERGSARLHIESVPVADLLNAFRWISSASREERITASAFYDAFLAHDRFDFSLQIANGNLLNRDAGFKLGHLTLSQQLTGFKALDGHKHFALQWSDFGINPRTETIDNDTAKEIALFMGYLPYEGDMDIQADNLHLDLLYKLAEQTSFNKETPIGLISLLPYLFSLEPMITETIHVNSNVLKLSVDAKAKVAFASLMNPILSGKANIEISGLPSLLKDIDEAQQDILSSYTEGLEALRGVIGGALGYANSQDGNIHTWEIITEPKLDGADVTINGYPFYSNEFMGGYMGMLSSTLPYLIMFGGMGMF